jgi:predicted dienelactone hydrolase
MLRILYVAILIINLFPVTLQAAEYNPLEVTAAGDVKMVELDVVDQARQRTIPVRVYYVADTKANPVIVHSHGLGGTRKTSEFLGRHWASRGYVAVFTQHPGSDDSIWKQAPLVERMRNMQQAASFQNLKLRAEDVTATLNQLEKWNKQAGHPLENMVDLEHVGMSGHSFGAMTTQAVSGQTFPLIKQTWTDSRIDAAIPMSPSSPLKGSISEAFAGVKIPWLIMTGTLDSALIGGQSVESRLNVYPNLPQSVDHYELVLDQAEHSVFTETNLPGDKHQRNPKHHDAIKALSTAFWDTYLKENTAAKTWL